MELDALLKAFGYAESGNLLRAGGTALESAPALGHVFRLAAAKRGLKAVYTLCPPDMDKGAPPVPVVYVCNAASEAEANDTHRLVWNQDVVPFVLVNTPQAVRLYSGFRYRRRNTGAADGLLRVLRSTNELLELSETLGAGAIDEGKVWSAWGKHIQPDARVDWQLLANLQKLDQWLQANGLGQDVSHALIGKYVYLRYLRDRDILSRRKLESWGIAEQEVFGREATITGVEHVIERLDDWLNGGVFPLRFGTKGSPRQEHLRRVAATFMGDQPLGDGSWQLHLDFQAYDFSYIPIETLSVVYEQFLHSPSAASSLTKAREAGAYYTPIPVVNFMLAEMESSRPLTRGTRVLDPSCGSGAFLVQCYRRLIEREYPRGSGKPGPIKLRELLQEHIFGVDRDPDACSVTELSLILTLLDYVDPPDLENDRRVKLPTLRNQNIFCEDFFAAAPAWRRLVLRDKFDWIVGNPPWKKLTPGKLGAADSLAWHFMSRSRTEGRPVAGNQLAEAFVWGAGDCLAPDGLAALLVPAMTLFEEKSAAFRGTFLRRYELNAVANFANLAEVLFARRSRVPSAAIFFRPRKTQGEIGEDEQVSFYAPFVINQEPTRPVEENRRQETWSLVVSASEIKDVPVTSLTGGDSLPFKLATWGSELDGRLLRRLAERFPSLGKLEAEGIFLASQGLELRTASASEQVEPLPKVDGQLRLDMKALEQLRHFFAFPSNALTRVPKENAFARQGRTGAPLQVCEPPHVIVSETRNFAIFSDEFVVIPHPQVGIISPARDRDLLIALSLYLASDVVFYHQFFTSPHMGTKRPIATLNALRALPIPIEALRGTGAGPWVDLHSKLVRTTERRFRATPESLFADGVAEIADGELLTELNDLAFKALGLSDVERILVSDLVGVKLQLDDGKLGRDAVRPPSNADLKRYARQLRAELDSFVEGETDFIHNVRVLSDEASGLVVIEQAPLNGSAHRVETYRIGEAEAHELAQLRGKLRQTQSQWVYFDRNLRVVQDGRILVLKPLQRVHWTLSQAIADANDVIAETVNSAGDEP